MVIQRSIPVAKWSKVLVCGRSLAGVAGSNPARDTDVCLSCVLYAVRHTSLLRADHSSRGVLPSVVCLTEGDCEISIKRRSWSTRGCRGRKKNSTTFDRLIRVRNYKR